MKCYTCGEEMVCHDDIVQETARIDWLHCPKCGSWSEIFYRRDGQKETVLWKRDKPKGSDEE